MSKMTLYGLLISAALVSICIKSEAQSLHQAYISEIPVILMEFEETTDNNYLAAGLIRPPYTLFADLYDSIGSVMVRMDQNYNTIWAKRYKTEHFEMFTGLTGLNDGNFLVRGTTGRYSEIASLSKMDPDGMILWSKTYDDSSGLMRASNVFEMPDASINYFVGGWESSNSSILHINPSGELINVTTFEGGDTAIAIHDVARDALGDFYLAGLYEDQFLLIKWDGNTIEWAYTYDVGGPLYFGDVELLPDGTVFITGHKSIDGGPFEVQDGMLLHTNANGTVIGGYQFDWDMFDWGGELRRMLDGIYWLSSQTTGLLATKFSVNGNLEWSQSYGNVGLIGTFFDAKSLSNGRILFLGANETGRVVVTDSLGNSYCETIQANPSIDTLAVLTSILPVTLGSRSFTEQTISYNVTDYPVEDSLICSDSTYVTEISEPGEEKFLLFPNPANEVLVIQGLPPGTTFSIFDVAGQLKIRETILGNFHTISIAHLSPGLYIVPETGRKFLIQR